MLACLAERWAKLWWLEVIGNSSNPVSPCWGANLVTGLRHDNGKQTFAKMGQTAAPPRRRRVVALPPGTRNKETKAEHRLPAQERKQNSICHGCQFKCGASLARLIYFPIVNPPQCVPSLDLEKARAESEINAAGPGRENTWRMHALDPLRGPAGCSLQALLRWPLSLAPAIVLYGRRTTVTAAGGGGRTW